jgi:outer membrane protein assembly factor BamB
MKPSERPGSSGVSIPPGGHAAFLPHRIRATSPSETYATGRGDHRRSNDGDALAGRRVEQGFIRPIREPLERTHPHRRPGSASPPRRETKIDTGDGQGLAWHTIVVFGERRGGRYYHALDITDPTNPRYLWSFTDPDGKSGESWSEPVIGKIKMSDGTEKYVAFFGGGYDTESNNTTGRAFFVVNVQTGQKLWNFKGGA